MVTIKNKDLKNIVKGLQGPFPVARVGILGDKNGRTGKKEESTNPEIGAAHEYGTSTLPQRSFLRMPISTMLDSYLDKANVFSSETFKIIARTGTIFYFMKQVAAISERVVMEAFASNGFGRWKSHAPGYKNNTGQILVDTNQLRNSISSEVV